uniref:Telomerase reverse transcriptase n=1 Tax=Timema cristinae TaxID=61476 RepID=A0A7R9CJF5_TIMCR|nr:unnamed protein product [Timema cristinae]
MSSQPWASAELASHYALLVSCSPGSVKVRPEVLSRSSPQAQSTSECSKSLLFVLRVIPLALFGTKLNFTKFLMAVKKLTTLGLFQNFILGSLVRGLRVSTVRWLDGVPGHAMKRHILAKEIDAEKIFELLFSYVEKQVVNYGSSWYMVKQGLPHGATLSAALCNFYYGIVDRHFDKLVSEEDTLVRIVDDYLFVTLDKQRAERFFNRMTEGFPKFNCNINKRKTQVNFSIGENLSVDKITFCGHVIDTCTLEVTGDYKRYKGKEIAYTMRLNNVGHPGKFLRERSCLLRGLKLNPLYLDGRINRQLLVLQSVFNAAILSAFRLHAIIRHTFTSLSRANQWFVLRIIAACASSLARKVVKATQAFPATLLTFHAARWLTFKAYYVKLSLHGSRYRLIVRRLEHLLERNSRDVHRDTLKVLEETTAKGLPHIFETVT